MLLLEEERGRRTVVIGRSRGGKRHTETNENVFEQRRITTKTCDFETEEGFRMERSRSIRKKCSRFGSRRLRISPNGETGDDAHEGVFLEDERRVVVFRIERGRREVHVSFTRGSYRRAEGKVERSATGEESFSRSDNRLDAILARVILLDQISRNVFRGTEKAFVGDECALRYSKFIVRERLGDDLPPAALGFIVSPFLHSELVEDHVLAEKFCRRMIEKNGANTPLEWTLKYVLGHKEVLEMFGRYPHRNEILGRETTVEEAQWLVSAQVPAWAKSQRRKKLDE